MLWLLCASLTEESNLLSWQGGGGGGVPRNALGSFPLKTSQIFLAH